MGADNLPLRWADRAMLPAEPFKDVDPGAGVVPKVTLVSMTADPLGVIASVLSMADGRVCDTSDVSDSDRQHYWEQSLATHLRAPWEFIELHFLIDGVPRWWTQQLERQRTATYFEQSLRFAVVENLSRSVSLPPSLVGTVDMEHEDYLSRDPRQAQRRVWDNAVYRIDSAYDRLINSGMPAEDARGLLPLATCTRVHYRTSLRGLAEHAGNRLCTQAQFLWRIVFSKIVESIRDYHPSCWVESKDQHWQFRTIADSEIFRPVCYSLGRCPWGADFDRGCKIRERVETNGRNGKPSSQWFDPEGDPELSINPAEWLADPAAARFK